MLMNFNAFVRQLLYHEIIYAPHISYVRRHIFFVSDTLRRIVSVCREEFCQREKALCFSQVTLNLSTRKFHLTMTGHVLISRSSGKMFSQDNYYCMRDSCEVVKNEDGMQFSTAG